MGGGESNIGECFLRICYTAYFNQNSNKVIGI